MYLVASGGWPFLEALWDDLLYRRPGGVGLCGHVSFNCPLGMSVSTISLSMSVSIVSLDMSISTVSLGMLVPTVSQIGFRPVATFNS